MAERIVSDRSRAVIGMGITGRSVARYWTRAGIDFDWYDTRSRPPELDAIAAEFPQVHLVTGHVDSWELDRYAELVLSPGLALATPTVASAQRAGVRVIGDIGIFVEAAAAPIAGITGSNGKSTVTRMVGEMALAAGWKAGIGGNLGTPALDLLDTETRVYVLELSSFQLETLDALHAEVACVLNLSQDHLDRYPSMLEYHAAKQRIYRGARQVVWNRDDPLTQPMASQSQQVSSFGLDAPDLGQYGILQCDGQEWLACGRMPLMPCAELALTGRHNWSNALAAYAIAVALGIESDSIRRVLREFQPLPHRCELVADRSAVQWIDDSKATNVGACVAAIRGLAANRNIVLIAGGQGKGQDFAPLAEAMQGTVHGLILIGEDARLVAAAAPADVQPVFAMSMRAAVDVAAEIARPGDIVLLSPACASLDMFENYAARGAAFRTAVEQLA